VFNKNRKFDMSNNQFKVTHAFSKKLKETNPLLFKSYEPRCIGRLVQLSGIDDPVELMNSFSPLRHDLSNSGGGWTDSKFYDSEDLISEPNKCHPENIIGCDMARCQLCGWHIEPGLSHRFYTECYTNSVITTLGCKCAGNYIGILNANGQRVAATEKQMRDIMIARKTFMKVLIKGVEFNENEYFLEQVKDGTVYRLNRSCFVYDKELNRFSFKAVEKDALTVKYPDNRVLVLSAVTDIRGLTMETPALKELIDILLIREKDKAESLLNPKPKRNSSRKAKNNDDDQTSLPLDGGSHA
jgi:hypothetical protein